MDQLGSHEGTRQRRKGSSIVSEIIALLEGRPSFTAKEIAERLDRPLVSVAAKLSELAKYEKIEAIKSTPCKYRRKP